MNFSAEKARRKWPCGRPACGVWPIVAVALALLLGAQAGPAAAAHRASPWPWGGLFGERSPRLRGSLVPVLVPLPRPRPAQAPARQVEPAVAAKQAPAPENKPAEPAAPQVQAQPQPQPQPEAPPQPSACRLALSEEIAIAPSIPDIHGPGGCGGEDLVRLEAVVLPDRHRVALTPPATLRCTMASAIADWIRTDVTGLAAGLGTEPVVLDNFDSYECRGFNRVAGAHLSEHGHANALDVRAIKLANGQSIGLTDRTVARDLRETLLHSVCARFMTVLGPGSDGYHEDHIHLDLMERHNNYRICQWNVWDPLPQIAPLLPAARPDEAPPREVAAKTDSDKPDAAKPDAAKSDAAKPDGGDAAPPTKKRRQDRRF